MKENEHNIKNFEDFYKLSKSYYKELKLINLNNQQLTKDDMIVLNDLLKEINSYICQLNKMKLKDKAYQLLDLNTKIIDVLLLIFNANDTTNKKITYILNLKLTNLETKFQILFSDEKVEMAEKVLFEIINIQDILKIPKYYIANTTFYLAVIKFFQNDIEESERLAQETLQRYEKRSNDTLPSGKIDDQNYLENKFTKKMSYTLELLGEIYNYKKDFNNSLACLEKAYYLNLGRFGNKHSYTEYYRVKLEGEKFKTHNLKITNLRNSHELIKRISINKEIKDSYFEFNGKGENFSFVIPHSNLYEPLLISISDLDGIFLSNLYFDKKGLFKYFRLNINNESLYQQSLLTAIIESVFVKNNSVGVNDVNLKRILINNQITKPHKINYY